jgi:hypothetical protein
MFRFWHREVLRELDVSHPSSGSKRKLGKKQDEACGKLPGMTTALFVVSTGDFSILIYWHPTLGYGFHIQR